MFPAIWTTGCLSFSTTEERKRFWEKVRAAVKGMGRAFAVRKYGEDAVHRAISSARKRPCYMGIASGLPQRPAHRRLARKLRPELVEEAQRRALEA